MVFVPESNEQILLLTLSTLSVTLSVYQSGSLPWKCAQIWKIRNVIRPCESRVSTLWAPCLVKHHAVFQSSPAQRKQFLVYEATAAYCIMCGSSFVSLFVVVVTVVDLPFLREAGGSLQSSLLFCSVTASLVSTIGVLTSRRGLSNVLGIMFATVRCFFLWDCVSWRTCPCDCLKFFFTGGSADKAFSSICNPDHDEKQMTTMSAKTLNLKGQVSHQLSSRLPDRRCSEVALTGLREEGGRAGKDAVCYSRNHRAYRVPGRQRSSKNRAESLRRLGQRICVSLVHGVDRVGTDVLKRHKITARFGICGFSDAQYLAFSWA